MRKTMNLVLGGVFLLSLLLGTLSFAEEKGMMKEEGMGQKGMMGKGMMGKEMMMHGMMMQMMEKSVVPTSAGGVIVMTANKLIKYDKDLALIKEVEIPMDMAGMNKMMKTMMEKCPMMDKGMMGGMDKQADKIQDSAPTASGEVDHKSHH